MAETLFSRQLDAAQEAHALRLQRKNRFVGRSWFNVGLAVLLVSIAVWVYRSPIADFVDNSPIVGRAQDSLVQSFGASIDEIVLRKQTAQVEAEEAAKKKAADEAAAVEAKKSEEAALAAAATTTTTAGPASPGKVKAAGAAGGSGSGSNGAKKQGVSGSAGKPAAAPVTAPPMAQILNPSASYFGVALNQTPFDLSPVDAFSVNAGKRPNLVAGYQTWDNDYRPNATTNAWKRGQMPMLSWEPMRANETIKLADIASGTYDDYVTRYATSIRDNGLPVALRFAHEMNGHWYPWSEGEMGNNPGDYVAAWQHIHNVFASVGATNVVWVWSPNVVGSNRELPLSQVYPGDDYVDFAGLSGYYRVDTGRTPSFDGTFKESLDAIRAVSTKPILLSEIGVGTSVENRVTWLNSMFESLPANPDVIGFVYFDYDKTTQEGSLQDWRIEYDPAVQEAFRVGIANPRYGSGL